MALEFWGSYYAANQHGLTAPPWPGTADARIRIILKRGRSGAKAAATNRRVDQQKNAWHGATC